MNRIFAALIAAPIFFPALVFAESVDIEDFFPHWGLCGNDRCQGQGEIVDGKREGLWAWYHARGEPMANGSFENGERDGQWVFYHQNGQLWGEARYKDGHLNGPWVMYYWNGDLARKGNYKNAARDGRWVIYGWDGNLDKENSGIYKEGARISE